MKAMTNKEVVFNPGEQATIMALLSDIKEWKIKTERNDLIAKPLSWYGENVFLTDSKIKSGLLRKLMDVDEVIEEEIPNDLVEISAVVNFPKGQPGNIWPQFLRKDAYAAFQQMSRDMKESGNGVIHVQSGYRSPAYQAVLFMQDLSRKKWDWEATADYIALPGKSQHGSSEVAAVDLITQDILLDGKSMTDAFEKTDQFRWLTKNAGKYGYSMPYFEGNLEGIKEEPWHWMWKPSMVLK